MCVDKEEWGWGWLELIGREGEGADTGGAAEGRSERGENDDGERVRTYWLGVKGLMWSLGGGRDFMRTKSVSVEEGERGEVSERRPPPTDTTTRVLTVSEMFEYGCIQS